MRNIVKRFTYALLSGGILVSIFLHGCSHEVNAQDLDAPYIATPEEVVEAMLDIANVGPGDYVIDLGSGDGRIVIAAARRGAIGHGVDIDPERVREAEENALSAELSDRVIFLEEDIFDTDFSRATVVTMFLLKSVNLELRPDILNKLTPGTRVVSHMFDMGDWKPDKHKLVDTRDVFFWIIPADVKGRWRWTSAGTEFSMNIDQLFQKIQIDIKADDTPLEVEHAELRGERVSFNARNAGTHIHYTFNGKVAGDSITGIVHIRGGNGRSIENWNAARR